jgi:ATP-dependent helicase HepA
VFLELYAVVEVVAPAALHVDRFLPATPVRVAVDHAYNDLTEDEALAGASLEKGDVFRLLDRGAVRKKILPAMLAKAQEIANTKMALIVEGASRAMDSQVQGEIDRLEDLQQLNENVRPDEIDALRNHKEGLRAAIATARLRVDALRLIFRMS